MTNKADLILLDDRQARAVAEELGLEAKGTIGILIEAKSRHEIEAVAPLLRALAQAGVWFSPSLIHEVLRRLGEAS